MTVDKVRVGLLAIVGVCILVIGGFCYHRANAATTYGVSYVGKQVCYSLRNPDYISHQCHKD